MIPPFNIIYFPVIIHILVFYYPYSGVRSFASHFEKLTENVASYL